MPYTVDRAGEGVRYTSGFTVAAPPGAPGNPSEARGVPHLGPGLVGVKPEVWPQVGVGEGSAACVAWRRRGGGGTSKLQSSRTLQDDPLQQG